MIHDFTGRAASIDAQQLVFAGSCGYRAAADRIVFTDDHLGIPADCPPDILATAQAQFEVDMALLEVIGLVDPNKCIHTVSDYVRYEMAVRQMLTELEAAWELQALAAAASERGES